MALNERWLLPEGIEEVIPPRAAELEILRRNLVDMYDSWGYELIMPPMVEFQEALMTGSARDLDLQTIKFVDQVSGRMLGLRADMTQQAARIDAHHFNTEAPVRLSYLGTVVRARPDGFGGTRSPLQVGCELFGHSGAESDVEIIALMIETLKQTGVKEFSIDLGHVGVFRGLAAQLGLDKRREAWLFDALQRKARTEIEEFVAGQSDPAAQLFLALIDLNGGFEVLDKAESALGGAGEACLAAVDELYALAAALKVEMPEVHFHFDLAELRGYRYQTGVVFAALVPGYGQEVARGGRYNAIGEAFGRARPATGFSADLKTLLMLGSHPTVARGNAVFAPSDADPAMKERVRQLREQGERVIGCLPGQEGDASALGCDRQLVKGEDGWSVESL